MESSVDAALGRVALVLRMIGAVWMILLATAYGLSQTGLDNPPVAVGVTILGVSWALIAWGSGWMRRATGQDWALLAADLVVAALVILIPAVVNETKGYTGGYPFAALVVGLAAAGRKGVIVAAAVLSLCTLIALGLVGNDISPFVVGQLLLYILGAVALSLGIDVIRGTEHRARRAEAALVIAEERASTATHLHDSVLQTLALVQRRADDAGAVRSLAKRQERELREWLFPVGVRAVAGATGAAGAGVGVGGAESSDLGARSGPKPARAELGPYRARKTATAGPATLGSALETHAEDIEERYGVAVRVITVGGAGTVALPQDERAGLCALVLAAREAMVNAAVHAKVDQVDVFAETDAGGVSVYIRDRGEGFDLDAVPTDRQGVRGSIIQRMQRAGGHARLSNTAGRGTEVQLQMPHEQPQQGEPR
ncbi:MAG: sensor histidine kinase [Euzebya sp.]